MKNKRVGREDGPSKADRRVDQPSASSSALTATALCLSRPERAYAAFERNSADAFSGWRKLRRVGRGERERYCICVSRFKIIKSREGGRTDACAEGLFCTAVPIIHRTWVFMEGVEEGAVRRF